MERPSLFSLLQPLGALLRGATVAMLFGIGTSSLQAQTAQWCNDVHVNGSFTANGFGIVDGNGGPSGNGFKYQCVGAHQTWGQNYGGPETYYTIPAGTGQQEFMVKVRYDALQGSYVSEPWYLYVDGQLCTSCSGRTMEVIQSTAYTSNGVTRYYNDALVRVRHNLDANWPSGIREFGLGVNDSQANGNLFQNTQIRFKAVMVGLQFTEVLGYYNAPSLPLYILRDPPGDGSYSSIAAGTQTCFGQSHSVTTDESVSGYVKAKIGVAGSAGIFVTTNFEIYVEAGVSMGASQSETSAFEYKTCLTATQEFKTSDDGTPDDVFVVSAVRYAYGMAKVIERPSFTTVNSEAYFASTPVGVNSSNNFTESYIRGTIIPQATTQIASLTPGTTAYKNAVNQLDVWHQMLALNDSIKATAPFEITRAFNGGGISYNHSLQTTTELSRKIDYKVVLEAGLSTEFCLNIGGSGIQVGAELKMRQEVGRSESGSNAVTNTMSYTLMDGDVMDNHTVDVHKDPVFGTYVFKLDSTASATSCKYEGGYRIDNPELSVGTLGSTNMTVNEAPIGSAVNFPLVLCNNSDYPRTYYLKFSAITNTQGAVMQAFGNTINSNDNGIQLLFQPHQCINTNLSLTQPNAGVVDFDNINLYLYALCEEEYAPYIRSFVTISAHFGAGNFGSYCTPVSANGTALGDYIDGVQLMAIANTGTGSAGGPTYTDHSAQFSTPLSRNAVRTVTITTGSRANGRYAAWIDYDRNGEFDANEKLGEVVSALAGEAVNITFTVPATAILGSTKMRLRAVHLEGGEPNPLEACFNYTYGETEDYAVVINANTPQDCAGVSNGTALPGTPCNDNNVNTGNDMWNANCECVGLLLDCTGTPGGNVNAGSPCNDNDTTTGSDTYNANCECVGLPYDCTGIPGGSATVGTPCNDNNGATGNDVYNAECQCVGQPFDCLGIPGGTTVPGTLCNDNNPLTTGDVFTANCICAGTLAEDCAGVAGGTAQPGTPCDDGNASTGNDVYGNDCNCAGLALDCAGVPGGSAAPGTPCNDGSVLTINDVYTADCVCLGTAPNDCAGVAGGPAQPGTPCDDGDGNTGNDAYDAFCNCEGQLIDCDGNIGGNRLPGTPCDDGNSATVNDAYTLGCECEGQLPTAITDANGTEVIYSVQPNPSNGLIYFNNPAQVPTRVDVRDGLGRVVFQGSIVTARASTIDLSGLAIGTYFLMAEAEGHRQVIKIMVQR